MRIILLAVLLQGTGPLERGIQLAQAGTLEEGERIFDPISTADPGYWTAQYLSAVAKAQQKKAVAARNQLARVLQHDPSHKDAHYLFGMLLEDASSLAQAEV